MDHHDLTRMSSMPTDASCHANSLPIPRAAPVTTATPPPYLEEEGGGQTVARCRRPVSRHHPSLFKVPLQLQRLATTFRGLSSSRSHCLDTTAPCTRAFVLLLANIRRARSDGKTGARQLMALLCAFETFGSDIFSLFYEVFLVERRRLGQLPVQKNGDCDAAQEENDWRELYPLVYLRLLCRRWM